MKNILLNIGSYILTQSLNRTALFGLVLAGTALVSSATPSAAQVAGGGFTHSGISGQYYSDSSFSNTAFTRSDVRLDFGTGNVSSPGGSPSAGYSAVGSSNWSAIWTGQFIPRFSD